MILSTITLYAALLEVLKILKSTFPIWNEAEVCLYNVAWAKLNMAEKKQLVDVNNKYTDSLMGLFEDGETLMLLNEEQGMISSKYFTGLVEELYPELLQGEHVVLFRLNENDEIYCTLSSGREVMIPK
jgi:hypothetical protein